MIRVDNLTKTFDKVEAVKGISFDVAQGEIFAFLGPNGAGKTTTIKMLTTLLRPTSGTIELDGLDPTRDQKEARQRFGIVFQDPSLDQDQTAYENMELHGVLYHVPRKLRAERIEMLLRAFRALGAARRLCENIFGRNEEAAGNRARTSSHPQDFVSGRAHARTRPAEPEPALDAGEAFERDREYDRFSDDTLYG